MGRSEEALAAFDRSLALRPDHPRTLHNRARLLRRMGRETEAAEAVARVLALEPHNADAWVSHAGLLAERAQRSGDPAEVAATVAAYRSAREHGADPGVIDHALAALGAAPAPAVAPRAYVEALFDGYAPKFDEHLRDALEYRTPEMLVGAAMRAGAAAGCDIVDLGCGTGLCGPLLRPIARSLVGVDLSARMLEQAAARGCYDRTEHAEIVEHLRAHPGAYDLAIAADVLIYLGDLADFVAAARAALRAGGLLAISVEHHAGDGFVLLPSRRFAHGDAYLRALAQANGLEVASLEHAPLRRDRDGSIEGTLAVMRRPPGVAR
jgi:predicted TPR repeat methyltransferase